MQAFGLVTREKSSELKINYESDNMAKIYLKRVKNYNNMCVTDNGEECWFFKNDKICHGYPCTDERVIYVEVRREEI